MIVGGSAWNYISEINLDHGKPVESGLVIF